MLLFYYYIVHGNFTPNKGARKVRPGGPSHHIDRRRGRLPSRPPPRGRALPRSPRPPRRLPKKILESKHLPFPERNPPFLSLPAPHIHSQFSTLLKNDSF
jgi:hypothetical protein